MTPPNQTYKRWRKTIAALALLTGVYLVAQTLAAVYPHRVKLRISLPTDIKVSELGLELKSGAQLFRDLRFRFEHDAPTVFEHTLEVSPGRYLLQLSARSPGTTRQVIHELVIPSQSPLELDFN